MARARVSIVYSGAESFPWLPGASAYLPGSSAEFIVTRVRGNAADIAPATWWRKGYWRVRNWLW